MGTLTPNMSIYKPSSGEELYNASFQLGLDFVDAHDHSGAPYNGVQIGTSGIQDGAITPDKLSGDIFAEATVTTTDDTPTEIAAIDVAEAQAITVQGRIVALRSTATEALGGEFVGTFFRPTGGSVQVIGSPTVNLNENFTGSPTFELVADTMNETISLQCIGETAKTIDWKVNYNVVSQP